MGWPRQKPEKHEQKAMCLAPTMIHLSFSPCSFFGENLEAWNSLGWMVPKKVSIKKNWGWTNLHPMSLLDFPVPRLFLLEPYNPASWMRRTKRTLWIWHQVTLEFVRSCPKTPKHNAEDVKAYVGQKDRFGRISRFLHIFKSLAVNNTAWTYLHVLLLSFVFVFSLSL